MSKDACPIPDDKNRLDKLREEFKDLPDSHFNEIEKKMDYLKLNQVAEQRCRSFGCKLEVCLYNMREPNKCNQLFRQLNYCIELEKKDIINTYKKTNKQVNY
jgi:hypothetical protein